jgi:spermidine synthase
VTLEPVRARTRARPATEPPPVLRPRAAAATVPVLGTVFLSGAVLLGVEMAASRVLAPFFGNSLFVWAAIIGVILGGLALGYWLGGVLADRFPSPFALAAVVAAGAVGVLSIPLLDRPVIDWVLRWDPGPRLDPVLCALFLFGPASVLLSAVGPVAVRLQVRALPNVGRTAGRTFAISTAGSIAGTFVTAFWLIPELGIEQLFVFAAALLFGTTMLVGAGARRPPLVAAGLVLAVATGGYAVSLGTQHIEPLTATSTRNWSPLYRTRGYGYLDARDPGAVVEAEGLKVVFAEDTRYHRLAVVDDADSRYLRFDNSLQSAMYLGDPFRTRYRYTDLFHLGIAYNDDARRVLYVGLGAGSSEKRLWRDFPRVQIDAVELDPVVVDVAYRYFHLPRDPRLRVQVGDGRRDLAGSERRFDVIVIDAFFADAIPAHLVTQEFLRLVRTRLAPGGVVVTNAIGALSGPGSRLFRSIYKTYRTVFPSVLVHPAILAGDSGDDQYRNLILVATEKAAPGRRQLADRWDALRDRVPSVPDLREPILDRHDLEIPTADVPVLTDDYAPTDALLLLFQ